MGPSHRGAALVLAVGLSVRPGSSLKAQVQRYYESDYTFYVRQASEHSMENIRAIQRIEEARRTAYAKVGNARIATGRASIAFARTPDFSITDHLLKKLADNPGGAQYVGLIREQAGPAKREYFALLAQEGLRQNDYVDAINFIFRHNYETLTGNSVPSDFSRQQSLQLRQTLLADAVFQGTSDLEKQTQLETLGVQTVYAMRQLVEGKAGNGAAGATAHQIAQGIVATLLGNNPDAAALTAIGRGQLPTPTKGRDTPPNPAPIPVGPASQGIPGAKVTYVYNTDLAVARNVAIESIEHLSVDYTQGLLDQFYRELGSRGGQRNNLADVGALVVFACYFVVSDGQELTPRQYAAVREQIRQTVLGSETIQQTHPTDLQFQVEKEIIYTAFNYANFRKHRAVLERGRAKQTHESEWYDASGLVQSERKIAFNTLDQILGNFKSLRLTPDGFVR